MLRASSPLVLSSTWANKPSSAAASGLYLFTDVGSSGTLMRYAGGRWRPLAGQAMLASLGAAVTGIATSETNVLQTLIPAGAWQNNDTLRVFITGAKSGTTNSLQVFVRVGTAGTTADTVITGMSGHVLLGAAQVAGGAIYDIKLISATSAQKIGSNQSATMSYAIGTTAAAAATTITDASANALYVSVNINSSGSPDTVSATSAQIVLVTP